MASQELCSLTFEGPVAIAVMSVNHSSGLSLRLTRPFQEIRTCERYEQVYVGCFALMPRSG